MKNKIKFNLSKATIIPCIIATSTLTSTCIPVFADTTTIPSNVEIQSILNTSNNQLIINSDNKIYNDFKKGMKVADFNFKVPDYSVNSYSLINYLYVSKINATQNSIKVSFNTQTGSEYSFYASPASMKDVLKTTCKKSKDDRIEIQTTEKSIGNTKGQVITLTGTQIKENSKVKIVQKFFSWQEDNIYYAVKYYDFAKDEIDPNGTVNNEINDDEVNKIITSLKKPDETTYINYFEKADIKDDMDQYLYDTDDFKNAENILGFKPDLVMNNNILKPEEAFVFYNYQSYAEKENGHFSFHVDYKLDDNFTFSLNESKDNTILDKIKHNKYYFSSSEKNDNVDISIDKLTINNTDVYKAKLARDDNSNTHKYAIAFEHNGIYYEIYKFDKNNDSSTEASLEKAVQLILSQNQ